MDFQCPDWCVIRPNYSNATLVASVLSRPAGRRLRRSRSSQAAWPVIKQVLASFPSGKIKYVQHLFPLWSHRQAFDTAKVPTWRALALPDQSRAVPAAEC
jgi:hypothetical protein